MIDCKETGTILTASYTGKRARCLPGPYINEFAETGLAVLPMHQQLAMTNRVYKGAEQAGRAELNTGAGGQGVGMIKQIRPAADVLQGIASQAEEILNAGIMSRVQSAV